MSDLTFNVPAMREALDKKNAAQQVYFYLFDYSPRRSWLVDGVGHATDIAALFSDVNFGNVGKDFPEMLANFVKNGVPSIGNMTIPEVENDSISYLRIMQNSKVEKNLWPDRLQFWNQQLKKYNFDWPSYGNYKNLL